MIGEIITATSWPLDPISTTAHDPLFITSFSLMVRFMVMLHSQIMSNFMSHSIVISGSYALIDRPHSRLSLGLQTVFPHARPTLLLLSSCQPILAKICKKSLQNLIKNTKNGPFERVCIWKPETWGKTALPNVNVACFARNVECYFFCDFQTLYT